MMKIVKTLWKKDVLDFSSWLPKYSFKKYNSDVGLYCLDIDELFDDFDIYSDNGNYKLYEWKYFNSPTFFQIIWKSTNTDNWICPIEYKMGETISLKLENSEKVIQLNHWMFTSI